MFGHSSRKPYSSVAMKAPRIIIGQFIHPIKLERAKQLRRNMTEAEITLWQHLRANRLNGLHFRRQQVIDGFIVDFYCHAASLVIEVDGEIHDQQQEYDQERDRTLAMKGLNILRISNNEIMQDLQQVLSHILVASKKERC